MSWCGRSHPTRNREVDTLLDYAGATDLTQTVVGAVLTLCIWPRWITGLSLAKWRAHPHMVILFHWKEGKPCQSWRVPWVLKLICRCGLLTVQRWVNSDLVLGLTGEWIVP